MTKQKPVFVGMIRDIIFGEGLLGTKMNSDKFEI